MHIAIAHFRAGLTDGVSLEMEKRRAILEEMGHTVSYIAGNHSGTIELHIPYFEYKSNQEVLALHKLGFEPDKEAEFTKELNRIADAIQKQIEDYYQQNPFQGIIIHNIFCLATCLPGTVAFARFLKNHPDIAAMTTHHDFFWEEARAAKSAFTNTAAQQVLEDYFPPQLPNLKHCVINSIAQQALKEKRGVEATVIPDTFDFEQPEWKETEHNKDFLHDIGLSQQDIIFLIAVRVRERKAVELAIDLVGEVTRRKKDLIGKTKWNGAQVTEDSRVVLVIPGEYTPMEQDYVNKLILRAQAQNVEILWIQDSIGSEKEVAAGTKKYALWDCYVYSDAVLYTSIWEGWGNQFIEAVFAKKPVVVFEYPVFTADIATQGFQVASMGTEYAVSMDTMVSVQPDHVTQAATDIMNTITDAQLYGETVNQNFAVGKEKYNTHTRLKKHLQETVLNRIS